MEFYFKRPVSGISISLAQLTLDLHAALAEGAPPRRRARAAAPAAQGGASQGAAAAGAQANADTGEKADWAVIRRLQWMLQSDGAIDNILAHARIELAGGAARVRAALASRAAPVPSTDENLAWQIAALGAEAVSAVVETPSLVDYFAHEIQPVDLPALTR